MLKSMFSSSIAQLNSLSALNDAMSRCSAGTNCSFTMCVFALDFTSLRLISQVHLFHREHAWRECLHFTGNPVPSEEPSSLCKRLSSISCERDVFPLSTKTRSVSSGFPDRSQIGLSLDWVGLENSTRGASPKDCWTSFPTGYCSTVEPDWSFPFVQMWSCFNEIFGGGRRDKCGPSHKTSPVFNLDRVW